jgi:hypothetical protein
MKFEAIKSMALCIHLPFAPVTYFVSQNLLKLLRFVANQRALVFLK